MSTEGTTAAKVRVYQATAPVFKALYAEIQDLAKKKPETTLNQTKVKLINRVLSEIKTIAQGEDTEKFLDLLSDDDLPQFSDVLLVLSQYSAALERFHELYFDESEYEWMISKKK